MTQLTEHCPSCESTDTYVEQTHDEFDYGVGDKAVKLRAEIPVLICNSCGFKYVGEEGVEAREIAVRAHLGLLMPSEIVAIRAAIGMSQRQFAELTRIGVASLARWESGAQLQSAALDTYLQLLRFRENIQRLQVWGQRAPQRQVRTFGRFQVLRGGALETQRKRADEFKLCA